MARKKLADVDDLQTAGLTARQLICAAASFTPEQFLLGRSEEASANVIDKVLSDIKRYIDQEPLAYILGEWEFYGLPLYVNSDVLIPRDDTCAVTSLAINHALFLEKDPRILDLCCGSGCIGLAVASRLKDARVTLADLSKDALNIAKKNIQRNKMGGRVSCIQLDALSKPPAYIGCFDMIISNPPYITSGEMTQLPKSVKDYEPSMALFGGQDGLDFYRAISQQYAGILKPGGFLCFEFGLGQGDAVCHILKSNDFTLLETINDYNDRERAVIAQYGRR